jgi:hypothetical protein
MNEACWNDGPKDRPDQRLSQRDPNDPMAKEYLAEMTRGLEAKLPDGFGFIVMAFPCNTVGDTRLTYTSNVKRADAIEVVKAWLFHNGVEEDWLKHIK